MDRAPTGAVDVPLGIARTLKQGWERSGVASEEWPIEA
jgi:hypothetical protein